MIESVDRAPELTREEEDDLIAALREAGTGQGVGIEAARKRIDAALKR